MASSMSSSAYVYVPLPNPSTYIRLLEVLPPTDTTDPSNGRIECTTRISKLDDAPEYHALSYIWRLPGEEEHVGEETKIYLDGSEKRVTRNLGRFLSQIRESVGPITLWIDAICIDQENDIERNNQVAIMGRIYSSALTVYAWLGLAADQSDEVIDLLNKLHDHGLLNAKGRNEVVRQFYDHGLTESLFKLCGRPYWRRVWIIQEIVLAKEVIFHCGTRQIACSILNEVFSGWSLQTSRDNTWKDWSALKGRFRHLSATWREDAFSQLPDNTVSWLTIKPDTPIGGYESQRFVERPFEIRGSCESGPHATFSRIDNCLGWSLEVITYGNLEYMEKYRLLRTDPDKRGNLIISETEGHASFVKGETLAFGQEHFQAKTAYTAIQIFWSGLRQTLAGTVLKARSEQKSRELAELITDYQDWQCSDARDHVYAILSMAVDYQHALLPHEHNQPALRPNYNWSRAQLFFETIRFCKDKDGIEMGRHLTKMLDIGLETHHNDNDSLVDQITTSLAKQDISQTLPLAVTKSDFLVTDLQPRRIKSSIDHSSYVYALDSSQWTGPNRLLVGIALDDGIDEIYAGAAESPYYVIPDKLCILSEEPAGFDVVFHFTAAEIFLVARPTSQEGIYTCIGVGGIPEAYDTARWSPRLRSSLMNVFWWLRQTPINVSQSPSNYYAEVSYPLYYLLLDNLTSNCYSMRARILSTAEVKVDPQRYLYRRALRDKHLHAPQKGFQIFGETPWDRFWSGESAETGDGARAIGAHRYGTSFCDSSGLCR